jgi:ribose/xylose/arabinose/galactoside ABC-type transport system permease subunit
MKVVSQKTRPYLILAATILVLALVDRGRGNVLSGATVFSALQYLATLGPVALGLSLTMLVREYDLSVAGVFGLAGCVAIPPADALDRRHAWRAVDRDRAGLCSDRQSDAVF